MMFPRASAAIAMSKGSGSKGARRRRRSMSNGTAAAAGGPIDFECFQAPGPGIRRIKFCYFEQLGNGFGGSRADPGQRRYRLFLQTAVSGRPDS